jgi:hypothetical protein
MAGLFTEAHAGDYRTSAKNILAAVRYFAANPTGRIETGLWTTPTWHEQDFRMWFRDCLAAKVNRLDLRTGRKHTKDYQIGQLVDCRIVREFARRIRRPGRNILRTPELKRRFGQVDNQMAA